MSLAVLIQVWVKKTNLHWEVVGSEAEVISATKWRELWAHVHLQVLEEVMILEK